MQTKLLHRKFNYLNYGIDTREYSQEVYEKYEKIESFIQLRQEKVSEKIILKILKIPRSTFYRWKQAYEKYGLIGLEKESTKPLNIRKSEFNSNVNNLILKIRKENPTWGKNKIKVILKREYDIEISESSVGRILKQLLDKQIIKPYYFYLGRIKNKKPRVFDKHAQRWKYWMRAKNPGEFIQVDHAVVEVEPGKFVKQFDAICPITKIIVSEAYGRATSSIAALFLKKMQNKFPFGIKSIKVDGGSEFMGDFEQFCKEKNIDLWVLPPKSPQYNGNVERSHGTIKYEFYSTYDQSFNLDQIRISLSIFIQRYNSYRPHQALGYLTPLEFYKNLETKKSQMS